MNRRGFVVSSFAWLCTGALVHAHEKSRVAGIADLIHMQLAYFGLNPKDVQLRIIDRKSTSVPIFVAVDPYKSLDVYLKIIEAISPSVHSFGIEGLEYDPERKRIQWVQVPEHDTLKIATLEDIARHTKRYKSIFGLEEPPEIAYKSAPVDCSRDLRQPNEPPRPPPPEPIWVTNQKGTPYYWREKIGKSYAKLNRQERAATILLSEFGKTPECGLRTVIGDSFYANAIGVVYDANQVETMAGILGRFGLSSIEVSRK